MTQVASQRQVDTVRDMAAAVAVDLDEPGIVPPAYRKTARRVTHGRAVPLDDLTELVTWLTRTRIDGGPARRVP